jgi:hypothetical protein
MVQQDSLLPQIITHNVPEVYDLYFFLEQQPTHGAWDTHENNERGKLLEAKGTRRTATVTPANKKRKPMGLCRQIFLLHPSLYSVD